MNSKLKIYTYNRLSNTNQKIYYSKNNEKINIKNKINTIFKYTNIVYDKNIKITSNGVVLEKNIIEKNSSGLITNMHEIIPFDTIDEIIEI